MNAKAKIIKKQDVPGFLDRLTAERRVVAPVKKDSRVMFERIESGQKACLDCTNTDMSPKDILFPQKETLFEYRTADLDVDIRVPRDDPDDQILFGVRPCDAKGILFLDKIFGGDIKDPYYEMRREKTTIVSLGCTHPDKACFCSSFGGGPMSAEGADIFLADIGYGYILNVLSEKGSRLIEGQGLKDAAPGELEQAEAAARQAEAAMEKVLDVEGLKRGLDNLFDNPIWARISETCLGCGICTYVCPTCHCFDLCDEVVFGQGGRIRIWDSCQYPLFTLQASGFNPRPTQKHRFRQRIMHKFSYLQDANEMFGCVGCGRCVRECPVNLDIREVLMTLSKVNA